MDAAQHADKPWIINLELTNACNLACVFCDHPVFLASGMKTRTMDPGLLEAAFFGLGDDVFHELGLVGLGEPTLNKCLPQHLAVIDRFADRFDRVSLNSNLVSLKESIATLLLNSAVNSYTFSLNASDRATYKEMMGRDCFDQAVANLRMFLSYRRSNRKDVRVAVQLFDSPRNSVAELHRLVPDLDDVHVFTREVYTKPVIREETPLLNVRQPVEQRRYPCWDIYTRLYLDVDGNVYPCTIGNDSYRASSDLCIGNVRRTSLMELFHGDRMRRARRASENGELPFAECEQCNVWSFTPNNFFWDETLHRWIRHEAPVRAYGITV